MITHQIGPIASGFRLISENPIHFGRYWRVFVVENFSRGSTPAISADSIQMKSEIGGINLSIDPTKAISDSNFSASFIEDYAFNGVNSQFWVSQNSNYGTHWIAYDFTTEVNINQIVWSKRPDNFGRNEAPLIGIVQYSNDMITWTTSWSFYTPATWAIGAETRTFTKSTLEGYRFWRIKPKKVQGVNYPFSGAEIEFKTISGGVDQCINGQDLSKNISQVYPPIRAFDGINNVPSNFFLSTINANTISDTWIGYCFPDLVNIVEITYQVRGDAFGANEAIVEADIQYSVDTINWITAWSIVTPSTWVNNSTEVRTFTKP